MSAGSISWDCDLARHAPPEISTVCADGFNEDCNRIIASGRSTLKVAECTMEHATIKPRKLGIISIAIR